MLCVTCSLQALYRSHAQCCSPAYRWLRKQEKRNMVTAISSICVISAVLSHHAISAALNIVCQHDVISPPLMFLHAGVNEGINTITEIKSTLILSQTHTVSNTNTHQLADGMLCVCVSQSFVVIVTISNNNIPVRSVIQSQCESSLTEPKSHSHTF